MSFFWFWQKNCQVCRNTNLSVQRKKLKIILLNNWFFVFFGLRKEKNCIFTGKFLAVLSKLLSTFPEEHLRSKISERRSWKLKDFWIIFEVLGTMAENLFQAWQNSNRCPREQFMEIFFQKRKIRYFLRFWSFFLLLAKNFATLAKPAI